MNPYFWILIGYVVGSTPFGYLAGRLLRGVDIRKEGSGNIGATNAMRVLGKKIGYSVFALDVLKGFVPVMLAKIYANLTVINGVEVEAFIPALTTIATILGHNFPFWLKFKGGKGIATSAGAMLPLIPITILLGLLVWLVVLAQSKFVSLASICAAVVLPLSVSLQCAYSGQWQRQLPVLVLAIIACALAIVRHRSNIERLLAGTERRSGESKEAHEARVQRRNGSAPEEG